MAELGLEAGRVRLVPYCESWPGLYEAEIARLAPFLASAGVDVAFEHSGSTAVPGLAAKPIIDILAGLVMIDDRTSVIAALQGAGYVHRGEHGIPGRDFFRRGEPRHYHLHLTALGSQFWQDHQDFRDWLRAHRHAAVEYAALKHALAERFPEDRKAYIDGKSSFVERTLRTARARRTA
jgi:GrpB-like predicted nucleotidyltransferase (UPF0157 family)